MRNIPRQSTTHIDSPAEVGARLREARTARGLRQGDLSFPGCSIGYISRIEAGLRVPSLQVIRTLAQSLGVPENWLATGGQDESECGGAVSGLRDATLALRLDQVDEAEELFLEIGTNSQEPEIVAQVEAGLGQIAFRRGHAHEAIAHLERAAMILPEFHDIAAADTLGRCYARVGDTTSAIAHFRRQLELATTAGDHSTRIRFAVLLANALIDNGSFSEATGILSNILSETGGGDPLELARVHWSQSRLHALADEKSAASRHARAALELLETTEHSYFRGKAHLLLAYTENEEGNGEAALELIRTGRAMLGHSPSAHDAAEFDLEEARALVLSGHPDEAASLAMAAAAIAGDTHPVDLGRCYGELAAAFETRGETERASELYELALEFLEGSPQPFHRRVLARYAEMLERIGRQPEAFELYKRAATLPTGERTTA